VVLEKIIEISANKKAKNIGLFGANLGRNVTWVVFNMLCDFRFIRKFNMVAGPIMLFY
jgi:hypothetical protein